MPSGTYIEIQTVLPWQLKVGQGYSGTQSHYSLVGGETGLGGVNARHPENRPD
jgi:hypothetical protein